MLYFIFSHTDKRSVFIGSPDNKWRDLFMLFRVRLNFDNCLIFEESIVPKNLFTVRNSLFNCFPYSKLCSTIVSDINRSIGPSRTKRELAKVSFSDAASFFEVDVSSNLVKLLKESENLEDIFTNLENLFFDQYESDENLHPKRKVRALNEKVHNVFEMMIAQSKIKNYDQFSRDIGYSQFLVFIVRGDPLL